MDWLLMSFSFLQMLLIPGMIIAYFVYRDRKHSGSSENKVHDKYVTNDTISEVLFMFSLLFFGSLLLAIKQQFHVNIPHEVLLLSLSLTGISLSYWFSLRFSLICSLVFFLSWWVLQSALWLIPHTSNGGSNGFNELSMIVKPMSVVSGFILLNIIYYLLSYVHDIVSFPLSRFKDIYAFFGLICVTGVLFVFANKEGITVFMNLTGGSIFHSVNLLIALSMLTICIVGLLLFLMQKKKISLYETLAIVTLVVGTLGILFVPDLRGQAVGYSYESVSSNASPIVTPLAIIFNILLFVELVGIILSGYMHRETWRINMGAGLLFVFIFVKYFDWFFTFLDKSIFFILAGILLFVVGYLMERGRRIMISAVRSQNVSVVQNPTKLV